MEERSPAMKMDEDPATSCAIASASTTPQRPSAGMPKESTLSPDVGHGWTRLEVKKLENIMDDYEGDVDWDVVAHELARACPVMNGAKARTGAHARSKWAKLAEPPWSGALASAHAGEELPPRAARRSTYAPVDDEIDPDAQTLTRAAPGELPIPAARSGAPTRRTASPAHSAHSSGKAKPRKSSSSSSSPRRKKSKAALPWSADDKTRLLHLVARQDVAQQDAQNLSIDWKAIGDAFDPPRETIACSSEFGATGGFASSPYTVLKELVLSHAEDDESQGGEKASAARSDTTSVRSTDKLPRRKTPVVSIKVQPFTAADDAELLRLYAGWPGEYKKISRSMKPPRHKRDVKDRLDELLAFRSASSGASTSAPPTKHGEANQSTKAPSSKIAKRPRSSPSLESVETPKKRTRLPAVGTPAPTIDISALTSSVLKRYGPGKTNYTVEVVAERDVARVEENSSVWARERVRRIACSLTSPLPTPSAPRTPARPASSSSVSSHSTPTPSKHVSLPVMANEPDGEPCDVLCQCGKPRRAPTGSIDEALRALAVLSEEYRSFL